MIPPCPPPPTPAEVPASAAPASLSAPEPVPHVGPKRRVSGKPADDELLSSLDGNDSLPDIDSDGFESGPPAAESPPTQATSRRKVIFGVHDETGDSGLITPGGDSALGTGFNSQIAILSEAQNILKKFPDGFKSVDFSSGARASSG